MPRKIELVLNGHVEHWYEQAAIGLAKAEELELPFLNEQKRVATKVAGRDG